MIAGHQGLCADPDRQLQYRNQRHGPGDYLDSGDGSAVCHWWLTAADLRTSAVGGLSGRKRRRARKRTEQALLKLAEGDYQQVEN